MIIEIVCVSIDLRCVAYVRAQTHTHIDYAHTHARISAMQHMISRFALPWGLW